MKTFIISDIEKKLNKTIRQNIISVGVDVAERYTGLCILKTTKTKITIEDLQVIETSNKDDHFHRAEHYGASLEKYRQTINKYKESKILVIERCYYGVNPETLIHLAHFGILTYYILKKDFDTHYYMGATSARSIIGFNQRRQQETGTLVAKCYTRDTKDKKGKIKHRKGEKKKIDCKSLVHNYLETDFGLKIENKDKADAFVLSCAGLLQ